ncbi:MAG: hypothetical protein R3Y45_04635 [Bacillota bacterium]
MKKLLRKMKFLKLSQANLSEAKKSIEGVKLFSRFFDGTLIFFGILFIMVTAVSLCANEYDIEDIKEIIQVMLIILAVVFSLLIVSNQFQNKSINQFKLKGSREDAEKVIDEYIKLWKHQKYVLVSSIYVVPLILSGVIVQIYIAQTINIYTIIFCFIGLICEIFAFVVLSFSTAINLWLDQCVAYDRIKEVGLKGYDDKNSK